MMIQDIYPRKLNNQYKPEACASSESFIISIRPGREPYVLCSDGEELCFPRMKDIAELSPEALRYLFSIDEETYYMYAPSGVPAEFSPEERRAMIGSFSYKSFRDLRDAGARPDHRFFGLYTAKHLIDWYRDTRFCGRCGTPFEHSPKERAKVCPSCGNMAFPRIMPAVIVGVINKDRILITRYRTGFAHNALIAGFTEIGETAEETVAREVMEEAGIHVKNIRYYKSQPWGTANDLLMGFYCDLDGDDEIHMDRQELKYAQWLMGDEIEFQPGNHSLTNEMMKVFASGDYPR